MGLLRTSQSQIPPWSLWSNGKRFTANQRADQTVD